MWVSDKKTLKAGIRTLLSFALAGALICGCGIGRTMQTSSLFAMNTIMEIEVQGDESLIRGAEDMIRSLEKELSVTDSESVIGELNETGQAELEGDTLEIVQRALDLCDETRGNLDISIYPVLRTWGFTTGTYRVPSDEELQELLKKTDYSRVRLIYDDHSGETEEKIGSADNPDMTCRAVLPDGMQIDLGSVVKGYTGSAIADYFEKEGVTCALINLGGNVQCIGRRPSGDKWKVAIKSPFPDSVSGVIGVIEAEDEAIITSGGYERYFEQDGKTYWHILDPKTGKPADSGLASVTVVGKDGLLCDGLSTALFVMGLDEAVDFWKSHDDFEAVFVTNGGEVYVTEGVFPDFSLTPEYRSQPLITVSRKND